MCQLASTTAGLPCNKESPPEKCPSDESTVYVRPENAFAAASWFSKLFFIWPYPLLKKGTQQTLTDADLYAGLENDSSKNSLDYFNRMWQAEQRRNPEKPCLRRAMLRDYFVSLWYIQPLLLLGATGKVVQAVALGKLIDFFQGLHSHGYFWAGILVFCGLVILFEHHHLFFFTWRKGSHMRVSVLAALYDKCFRLSSIRQGSSASYGKVMNLASNDVERFLMAALFINYLIWAPLQTLAILAVGYTMLGEAFVAGFALLICVFVPLQVYLSGKFAHYRGKIAAITDNRVTFVSQAVRGARVMKMSGYEDRFLQRIMQYREEEVSKIAQANTLKCWNEALFFSSNVVISLVIFLVHVHTGKVLHQGDVFAVFTLINILQLELTKHMSIAVMATSEVYVSIGRIQQYLEYPEIEMDVVADETMDIDSEVLCDTPLDGDIVVALEQVSCFWKPKTGKSDSSSDTESLSEAGSTASFRAPIPALLDVSLNFRRGELTAVIGTVGSSKSALLQAIVKELPASSGRIVSEYKSLAYAPQDPWIMDGTVKENILMGLELNDEWYNKVVEACALVLDFQQFSRGDSTILGDRGVQCSGGQRARIGLARAIYRDSDVLVVDDPLSAVDTKVGRQLFQEALLGLGVHRGKCVILATHQHQYVNECRCVMMSGGRVECAGSYEECVAASNGKLTAHAADDAVDSLVVDSQLGNSMTDLNGPGTIPLNEGAQLQDRSEADHKEMNREGSVEWDTYLNYLRAMGGVWIGFFLFILFSATQGSVLYTITTVGRWTERSEEDQDNWDFNGLVIGLGGLVVVLSLVRVFICFYLTNKAAKVLHNRMAHSILRARIQFFDTNPLGRILNRFSADTGILDDHLPPTIFDFYMLAFVVLGAVATTVVTLPFVLIAIPLLGWYFIVVRGIFVTSSRELKRLEGLARSPIFAMLSEVLGGIATIRSNDAIDYFKKKFQAAHDTHTRCFFVYIAASRWVGFRMDSLVFLFLTIVSFLSVLFHQKRWFNVDPAILGLSLSMLLQLTGVFQWCIRQSAEVVNQMVSVERVLAFGKLESEAPLEIDSDKSITDSDWPSQGAISVENVSMRYRASLPLALDSISFSIPPGSRVGIVGRSGSGKSTLMQGLFRLLESEEGRIVIDGVDISKLGLHALRTKLSVIPQTPTLFSGCTVRENLDLFGLHSDDALLKVIADCHLTQMIEDLPDGLDSIVSDGSFSTGQRQLLCLARALLCKNKILVLDEATASVDRRTDYLLQEALHESFRDGTILAIAHRLITIIEYDYCVVLGGGKLLEFGTPADLIRAGGAFASMVSDTGETMSNELTQRALKQESKTRKDR
jgi:ATP-binding cassette, subfamily C (CFTR/MRP), member 4